MEPTVSELQAQIDRLSLAVRQRREASGHLEPVEQQVSLLVERCAEILNRWTDADQRRARAIGEVEARLGEWTAIEGRLEEGSLQRMRELESVVRHEWQALRQMHEEPVRQLREQSEALGEICAKAAQLAVQGFERAEVRFAALERDLQAQLGQLSRDLQTALAELRRGAGPALGADVAPFPLEGVMRIHEELREPASGAAQLPAPRLDGPAPDPAAAPERLPVRQLPEAAALSDRIGLLERELTSEREEVRETATRADRLRRDWRLALGVLAAVIVVGGAIGLGVWQRVDARLDDAAARVTAAERQAGAASDAATRQIATARADADRQIAEARGLASRAEIVSSVLAAPDLVRFSLIGTDQAERAAAQVLWSRSRGLVVSASRLPVATADTLYQVWLLTDTAPVSAGTFVADSTGRATLAADNLPNVPRPVTGVMVTVEPAGGRPSPTGVTVLSRAPQ